MCLRNKVLKTLRYVRIFTYFGAANITSKQKTDMTKVAIKNVNITSFGGIYHIMDVFSKLGFEKLTESVLGKRGSSGKAFCYGSIFCGYHTSPWFGWGIFCLEKSQETPKHLILTYRVPKKISQHIKFSHKNNIAKLRYNMIY